MALSIKTEEADRLARELAAATGESLTQAVTVAIRERLLRIRADKDAYLERVRRIQEEFATARVIDTRSDEEIIGYDEHGLPA